MEGLWGERSSSSAGSALPVWIIEYAWSNQMMEVLQVLGPPPWLEVERRNLTLKDPCSIRVTAAETWMIVRARDTKHFERVMEFLHVTHTLLPRLVAPIKHMKIMFGLKTLVIMRMLWDEQSIGSIRDKTEKFFPDSLSQYRRSSHRHKELMQKAQRDFRNFVHLLTESPEMRKNYIRNLMEEQYGERYMMKLEERLLHYLEELNKALPQPTYIDQVLKHSGPLKEREEFLQQLFTCSSAPPATALKNLLRCAMGSHMVHKSGEMSQQQKGAPSEGTQCDGSSLEALEEPWLSQAPAQSSALNENKSLEKPSLKMKPVLEQADEPSSQPPEIRTAKAKKAEDDVAEHLCSRHGKTTKSFLQECSEELMSQDSEASLTQVDWTPSSPLPPLPQSTPHSPTSASSPHDSSTNVSVNDEHQVVPSQISPAQNNSSSLCSCQQNIITFSECSGQPSQTSSSSITDISPFPENKLSPESSPAEQEYSPLLFFTESSYHHPGDSSSSFSAPPETTSSPAQNDVQVSSDPDEIFSALKGKPRLSLETQAFLLVCKWLQPQVKLCRLSRHECQRATLPNRAPEQSEDEDDEEYASFDVNLLYSDSESDVQDSDDSDYVPSKRCRCK